MDLIDAMNLWKKLGHIYVSWNTKEAYWILFVKDGEVVGHVKTVTGCMFWDWPEELMKNKGE